MSAQPVSCYESYWLYFLVSLAIAKIYQWAKGELKDFCKKQINFKLSILLGIIFYIFFYCIKKDSAKSFWVGFLIFIASLAVFFIAELISAYESNDYDDKFF